MKLKHLLVATLATFCLSNLVAAELYVSKETGKNSNAGTKEAPFKNLQKALDKAAAGDVIYVAAGNYFGLMDKGYLEMKKPVKLYGGYTTDFSARDILENRTLIMPPHTSNGTSSNNALLNIYPTEAGDIVVDGFIFDKGESNGYHATEGKPEGVETGMLIHPPTRGANNILTVVNPHIKGTIPKGTVLVQNNVFLNGSHYAIQADIKEGKFSVLNNVFVANTMAAAEIRGASAKAHDSSLEFAYNTILFTWSRTKANEDMGYGVRAMTRIDTNIHNNLIGCSSFAGIDRTRIDSDLKMEGDRVINIDNNRFFANKQADMALPSGGGKFLRIYAEMMEDAEGVTSVENNAELEDVEALKNVINQAYLTGFLNAVYTETTDYDPNSPANQIRSMFGLNQVGTMQSSASMFANRYPQDDALKLFGVVEDIGAQAINYDTEPAN
ncbi:MAG: DUF1565 domain-containing protein [Campylobacteraceae bacterium]|nr:DUF1565 domain-containing protein [Campylobacteraceae bacterium]